MILILIILICGCVDVSAQPEIKTEDTSKEGDKMETEDTSQEKVQMETEFRYIEGTWNRDWDNIEFPFEDDCVPDKETAIKIANIFLENLQKRNCYINHVPQAVLYDTETKIWIVTFGEPDYMVDGVVVVTLGDEIRIAIRKENAEVVKMWLEE